MGLRFIYFLGLIIFLIRFIFQLAKIIEPILKNPTVKTNDFTYVLLPNKTSPYTFLSYLFIDQISFQKNTVENEILHHELTHIRQNHSWDILFIELLKIAFWFNPLLSLYKKSIQLNHEFLADEAVTTKFSGKAAYQLLLLERIQRSDSSLSLGSSFNSSTTKTSTTKRRIIMMGKSSSLFKSKLYKAFSLVLAMFTMLILSSNKPYSSTISYYEPENEFEQILANASKDENPYELVLNNLDLPALRKAYLTLSEEEKKAGTEFPFFDPMTFDRLLELQQSYPAVKTIIFFETPPDKNEISIDVYEQWKNTKNIELTIDDVKRETAELKNHLTTDFAMFTVRETKKKGIFVNTEYQISLYTQEFYFEKHLKARKKIKLIQSEYPNAVKVEVPFHQNYIAMKDGKIIEQNPKNYEASIFHQLNSIHPSLFEMEIKKPQDLYISNGFSAAVLTEGKPLFITRLPIIP